jgi:hypothetical protein
MRPPPDTWSSSSCGVPPKRALGRFAKRPAAYDHWHRNETDPGRPYAFTSAMQLLDDFWREVKRVMKEKGIANDL